MSILNTHLQDQHYFPFPGRMVQFTCSPHLPDVPAKSSACTNKILRIVNKTPVRLPNDGAASPSNNCREERHHKVFKKSLRVQLLHDVCESKALLDLHVPDLFKDLLKVLIEESIHDCLDVFGQGAACALVHRVLTDHV